MKHLIRTFLILASLCVALPIQARELVIDMTEDVVPITANFVGTDLLLYGASEDGGDVLVVVRGPNHEETVRRKEKKTIIWANGKEVTFESAPSFYFLASTRPLDEFLSKSVAKTEQIGYPALTLQAKDGKVEGDNIEEFRKALIRNKQRQGLYGIGPGLVRFKGKHLFRTQLHFPANVPVGDYKIDIYLFKGDKIVNKKTMVLPVQKFGAEAFIYNFAHRHALPYGVLAILIAAVAGWLANIIFRKA
jgi:uncharacterized protein (TIGR02186 family)